MGLQFQIEEANIKSPVDPQVQERLLKEWLPQVMQLPRGRRFIHYLMVSVLVSPLVLFVLFAIFCIIHSNEFTLKTGSLAMTLLGVLLGLSAFCFFYLGKLQECADNVLLIQFALIAGDQQRLYAVISNITCYGSFRSILQDARDILPKN